MQIQDTVLILFVSFKAFLIGTFLEQNRLLGLSHLLDRRCDFLCEEDNDVFKEINAIVQKSNCSEGQVNF